MGEHKQAASTYQWAAYSPTLAVLWRADPTPTGAARTVTWRKVAVTVYGDITSELLAGQGRLILLPPSGGRDLAVYGIFPLGEPTSEPGPPPTRERIEGVWDPQRVTGPRIAIADIDCSKRYADETRDEFLRRIADAYVNFSITTGTPTKTIAEQAGVTKTAAGRWIRDARLVGLLPSVSRGRISGARPS